MRAPEIVIRRNGRHFDRWHWRHDDMPAQKKREEKTFHIPPTRQLHRKGQ